jgi:hypothetical protein
VVFVVINFFYSIRVNPCDPRQKGFFMKRRQVLALGGAALASLAGCGGKGKAKIQAGFGSAVMNKTFNDVYPFHDDLEANALYITDGIVKFALVSLDFGQIPYRIGLVIRRGVALSTWVPMENMIIHCTNNLSGPMSDDLHGLDVTGISEAISKAVTMAQYAVKPAEMAYATVKVGNRFSINRRMHIDDDLRTLTFWNGFNYLDDGRVDARPLFNELLTRWYGNIPEKYRSTEPLIDDGPVDELLQAFTFRDEKTQKILGSIVRFAAHVQLARCASKPFYSSDTPGQVRQRLREVLGGQALFINGPCGDLTAKEFMKFKPDKGKYNRVSSPFGPSSEWSCIDDAVVWDTVQSEGRAMADKALEALKSAAYVPLTGFKTTSAKELMPLREDMPSDLKNYDFDGAEKKAMDACKQAVASKAPVSKVKTLADASNRAHWMRNIVKWFGISEEDLHNRTTPYELQAFSLNDISFAGLPGETMKSTCDALRAAFRGDRLITMTECNADLGYIASKDMFPEGSYEVTGGVQDASGEEKLREAAVEILKKV